MRHGGTQSLCPPPQAPSRKGKSTLPLIAGQAPSRKGKSLPRRKRRSATSARRSAPEYRKPLCRAFGPRARRKRPDAAFRRPEAQALPPFPLRSGNAPCLSAPRDCGRDRPCREAEQRGARTLVPTCRGGLFSPACLSGGASPRELPFRGCGVSPHAFFPGLPAGPGRRSDTSPPPSASLCPFLSPGRRSDASGHAPRSFRIRLSGAAGGRRRRGSGRSLFRRPRLRRYIGGRVWRRGRAVLLYRGIRRPFWP